MDGAGGGVPCMPPLNSHRARLVAATATPTARGWSSSARFYPTRSLKATSGLNSSSEQESNTAENRPIKQEGSDSIKRTIISGSFPPDWLEFLCLHFVNCWVISIGRWLSRCHTIQSRMNQRVLHVIGGVF